LNIVFDGRLRQEPSEKRAFSLFFAVTRADPDDETRIPINMSLGYADVSIPKVTVTLPNAAAKHEETIENTSVPQIPIMYNNAVVKAQTMLCCTRDLDLKKIDSQIAKKRAITLKKEHEVAGAEAKKAKKG
jgi:hypothetical protein